jgi:hypothetical protein
MKSSTKRAIALLSFNAVLLVSGCTMEGSLSESSYNKIIDCKDNRTNSTFTFNTNSIQNIHIGLGSSSFFDVVDFNGNARTIINDGGVTVSCKQDHKEQSTAVIVAASNN